MEKSIYSDEYQTFLKCLRKARRSSGLTQGQLAERLGENTTQSDISKCERGERRVDIIELRAFCRAMGISFESFVQQLENALNSNNVE